MEENRNNSDQWLAVLRDDIQHAFRAPRLNLRGTIRGRCTRGVCVKLARQYLDEEDKEIHTGRVTAYY